ncbi:MAG: 2-thiouracil desulfurase family protein [Labilithrix sp.]
MLVAYRPDVLEGLREATREEPLRVLVSGCLAGWGCGVDGTDYGMKGALAELLARQDVRAFPFCPEQHALGTPRTMPDIHGGDGVDVIAGRARVLDQHGIDLSAKMIEGGRAMVAFALESRVELALLTDMSAACGSQVISLGGRFDSPRRFQKGVGVATALLLEAGVPVLSQRDLRSLERLRRRLEARHRPDPEALDHHEHPWTREHLPGRHPRQ